MISAAHNCNLFIQNHKVLCLNQQSFNNGIFINIGFGERLTQNRGSICADYDYIITISVKYRLLPRPPDYNNEWRIRSKVTDRTMMLCMFEYEWRRPYSQRWNQQTTFSCNSSVAISKNSLRWSVCSPLKNITVYSKIILLWLEILFNPGSTIGFILVTFDSPGCTHIDTNHSLLPISHTHFSHFIYLLIYFYLFK